MKYTLISLFGVCAAAVASEPTKGSADLGAFMLHFEASPETAGVALYSRDDKFPSYSITKEPGKAPQAIIWTEKDGVSTFYKDTDGDGVFDEVMIRRPGSLKKFKLKVEMIEIELDKKEK
jgi:hypothetical protein